MPDRMPDLSGAAENHVFGDGQWVTPGMAAGQEKACQRANILKSAIGMI